MSGNGERASERKEPALPPAIVPQQGGGAEALSRCTTDGWQIVSASVPGAIHERSGARNQDALSWWSAEGERPLAVLCVADGHGGREYTRSHIGARRAVKEAQMLLVSEVLPRVLDGSALTDLARFKRDRIEQLPRDLVQRWRESNL